MTLPECLQQPALIVAVDAPAPDADRDRVDQLVPALEVMVQEGIRVFSLVPADMPVLAELREIFDERADFGIHDVADALTLVDVLGQRPAFVLLNSDDEDMVRRGNEAGVAVLPAALTPNEIRRAARSGAPAVQVMPADLFGSSYPIQLRQLLPDVTLVPRGSLGAWAIGRWVEEGSTICVADTNLIGDSLQDGNLSHLRDRARSFSDSMKRTD